MKSGRLLFCALMFLLLCLAGCGGGGGSSVTSAQLPSQPNTKTVKLSTSAAASQNVVLSGVGITLTLPAGVTVKTDASGGVASGVINVAGVAVPGTAIAVYHAATATTQATLELLVASSAVAGFGTGDFATVTFELESGRSPKAAEFGLSSFKPYDLSGTAVSGLTPALQ
ncbi:MAG TPA: hypothetical protein VJ550_01835 [Geomonas sp.]|nr:hypothetical protein [Geomonas sp.]